jgi:hypothetical protein
VAHELARAARGSNEQVWLDDPHDLFLLADPRRFGREIKCGFISSCTPEKVVV